MHSKKAAYFLMVLSGLLFVGCGGGSSSSGTSSDTVIPDDNTTTDDHFTLGDLEDVTVHDRFFESDHFSGSDNCVNCHSGIKDENGTDVSLVNAWQGTIMANAATDPLYLAKVASEVQRNPKYTAEIEAKCSRCHLPMANVEAGFAGDPIAMSGVDSFLDPLNPHYDAAKDGVSCTLCHQIENSPELGTFDGFSGGFQIADNEGVERKIYGPYENPKTGPMATSQNKVDFTPVYSEHMRDSKHCATCHNLDTPVISADGNLTDPLQHFPEQAVYTEWEYSDFNDSGKSAQSCQECHMPLAEGGVVISTMGNVGTREPFRQHKFLGANTYMLEILKNNRDKLGAVASEARFEESITDTREFLKAAANVNIINTNFANGTLSFDVNITNHSGHKFPTSLPTRRAWLHVKVTDQNDIVVFESGAWDSSTNRIIGVDDNTEKYEPHYTDINDSSQVQVYESIMADTDGKHTYTFMNAASYLKDNRILPKGFDKNSVPPNIRVYGNAKDDGDFIGGSDTVNYSIGNLSENIEYTITATLRYQTASYGFMQDLYKDIHLTAVELMKMLDDTTANHFEDNISTDTASSSEQ